jgi:chemotaxis protein MotB
MAKKIQDEAPQGAPAWMATYGDLVTLLLCFFVLLYAMSDVNTEKLQRIAASLSGDPIIVMTTAGTDGITEMLGNGIMEVPIVPPTTTRQIQEAQDELSRMASDFETYFAENNLMDSIEVELNEGSIMLSFKDGILFDSGRANIRPQAFEVLEVVGNELLNHPNNDIHIVGHTDNVPINTVQFPNNWILSASRAINVGLFFIEQGIDPSRISTIGRGEYFPIAPNDTPENRARNRRVEIFIISSYL